MNTRCANVDVYSLQEDVLGEGPLWSASEGALYWLDIGCKLLYCKDSMEAKPKSWILPDYPGCLAELEPGVVAIAMSEGVQRFNLQSAAVDLICAAPSRATGTRFNDGKVDPRGRFWAGTMQNNFGPTGELIAVERSEGALYRFESDSQVFTIDENIGIANTLAWSPGANRFYFADSFKGQIFVYDFDADSGAVHHKRLFFESSSHGVPDGSAMDVDGCLWNARWDGGALVRITPDGRLDRQITLPVRRPTSCAFGGAGLKSLFVTSARAGLTASQLAQYPLSGSVFVIRGIGEGMKVPTMRCGPTL